MPACSSSVRRTRRRVSSWSSLTLTRRRNSRRAPADTLVERLVDRFGPPPDGAGETAGGGELGERDRVRIPPAEQLGHGVLNERQGAGLQFGVGHDPPDEGGLDLYTHRRGRKPHRLAELRGGQHTKDNRSPPDGVAEAWVPEGTVEVVGPQRRDDADQSLRTPSELHRSSRGTLAAHLRRPSA